MSRYRLIHFTASDTYGLVDMHDFDASPPRPITFKSSPPHHSDVAQWKSTRRRLRRREVLRFNPQRRSDMHPWRNW